MSPKNWLIALALLTAGPALAQSVPGVTASEIKIGNLMPYSGPASSYGQIGRLEEGFFRMINEKGGINGRKINFQTLDDGYSPPRAVEQTRRLVEQDQVAFMFNALGTPSSVAVQKYLNIKKVPQLFVATGSDQWGNYKQNPWTMGWQPSYRTEAQIYGKYILKTMPDAKIAVLYQNDDFGKDYVEGLKDVLGERYGRMVVASASYEVTDPTIDSQAATLQASGATVLVSAATPKFAAQIVRRIFDIGWKPVHFMTNVSISVGSVLKPAGLEKAVGLISAAYDKDPTDATWKNDAGMNEWRDFMKKYMPDADLTDNNNVYAFGVSMTLMQVLKQCGSDLSRANVMKQAASLDNLTLPTLLPGITISTSATNFHPIRQMQLQKWTGQGWELFGQVISGENS